jgi:carbonic anhydrase/acetyltransferase-like protein (isoleucine patch superfamily)
MIIPFNGKTPRVHPSAFIAPTAVLVGDVEIGPESSVWFGAVLRADYQPIRLGARSNIQDNSVVHVDRDQGCYIGDQCTIGHGAILHTARIADRVLVGNGATVMEATVGEDSVIAPGAVVIDHTDVPPGSLVTGVPGVVKKSVSPEVRAHILTASEHYVENTRRMRDAISTPLA